MRLLSPAAFSIISAAVVVATNATLDESHAETGTRIDHKSEAVIAKGAPNSWVLSWSDEFDGTTLNTSLWNVSFLLAKSDNPPQLAIVKQC